MKYKVTSVKIDNDLFNQFKTEYGPAKFYLQDLLNRSLSLFMSDEVFRTKILNTNISITTNKELSQLANNVILTRLAGSSEKSPHPSSINILPSAVAPLPSPEFPTPTNPEDVAPNDFPIEYLSEDELTDLKSLIE